MSIGSIDETHLTDEEIDLDLEATDPPDPSRGHVLQFHYAIRRHGTEEKVGSLRLRLGEHASLLTAGHIGYSVAEGHRGHHLARRACLLVKPVAIQHGLERLVITCDPTNEASRRTCEHLGARFVGEFDVPVDHEMYRKGARRICRYDPSLAVGREFSSETV